MRRVLTGFGVACLCACSSPPTPHESLDALEIAGVVRGALLQTQLPVDERQIAQAFQAVLEAREAAGTDPEAPLTKKEILGGLGTLLTGLGAGWMAKRKKLSKPSNTGLTTGSI